MALRYKAARAGTGRDTHGAEKMRTSMGRRRGTVLGRLCGPRLANRRSFGTGAGVEYAVGAAAAVFCLRCRLWAGRAALAVLWLLFLPNTFYMLTDLIHTPQKMEWVNAADWTVRHSENVSDWLLTLLLGTGAVLAVLLGLEAMRVFRVYCCVHWPRPAVWAGGGTVLLLCGFGMYIGRFLRLNSWDILHPLALLRRVWASMGAFQLQVTLLFAGAFFLLWLAYGALRPVDGEKQENKKSDALST